VSVVEAIQGARLAEEERLIARAQSGDLAAIRPLFERYADPLYCGVVLPRLGNPALAEDIVKDTFVTAMERLRTFRWEGRGIYGWLRQIAIRKVIDWHRRAQRTDRILDRFAEEQPLCADDVPLADEAIIKAEERRQNLSRLEEALGRLPPRYRQVLELRLVEEVPREECAGHLGVTVGNLDVLLHRALRAFRKQFLGESS
jgi:RNA polymerase sigma-70 factor (ECF subfamily)